jgi:hydroxyethylthiazole kinase-like uncharacterized protein yjeF
MTPVPILTPDQAAHWDSEAVDSGRVLRVLMENAGRAVARAILSEYPAEAATGVLFACGPGNNGGDGWVAARALHMIGLPVWVTEVAAPVGTAASEVRHDALADGVATVEIDGPWPRPGVLVDALLGGGARGRPREPIPTLLDRLRGLDLPVVAVDGPTGIDLSTGSDHGALAASLTVTFGGVRRGHLLARDDVGDVTVAEVGLTTAGPGLPLLVDSGWAAERIRPFEADFHKGDRGRVVIVGGNVGMSGAARLTSRGAFAAGAGTVRAIVSNEVERELRTAEPDLLVQGCDFTADLPTAYRDSIAAADCVVIGPGLGREAGMEQFVFTVLESCRAAVVDADALTVMGRCRDRLVELAIDVPLVLTPHPGEFRTLFPEHSGLVETDPWGAVAAAMEELPATILLKGVPTVIGSRESGMLTVANGNPGLATGGSGDILSGILAALFRVGAGPHEAAAVAAQALGHAADIAAERGSVRTMRPMDVVAALTDVWSLWSSGRASLPHGELMLLPRPLTK